MRFWLYLDVLTGLIRVEYTSSLVNETLCLEPYARSTPQVVFLLATTDA